MFDRFTIEEAKAAMEQHGVTLQHNTWGFAMACTGRKSTVGCAAALMVLHRAGGREALDEEWDKMTQAPKVTPGDPFTMFGRVSGVPVPYLMGVEMGFERPEIAMSSDRSPEFTLGVEDGEALRSLVEDTSTCQRVSQG